MMIYVRFLVYDDPSRQSTTPLGTDIATNKHPSFGYGKALRIGDSSIDKSEWEVFIVANIPRLKQINDPTNLHDHALVYEVYLVKPEDWESFDIPSEVQQAVTYEQRKANGDIETHLFE